MTRLSRRTAALGLAVAVTLAGSGCSAGFDAQTNQSYTPSNGQMGRVGDLKVRSVLLVASEGSAVAELLAGFVNIGPVGDRLVGVQVQDADPVDLPDGPLTIEPGVNVLVGGPDGPRVFVRGLTRQPGQQATVRLEFERSGILDLDGVLIQEPSAVQAGG